MSNDTLQQDTFFEEANRIFSLASKEGIILRLLGAMAIRLHSQTAKNTSGNRPITDLDFVGLKKDRKKIEDLFSRLGYEPDKTFNMLHGAERLLFLGYNSKLKVDVWLEVFRMAHTFNFKDRLELGDITLPLADLLMTKLQIVQLNEKDVRDVMSLLVDHNLSDNDKDPERINLSRLVHECSENWGTYKTFTMNIGTIKGFAPKYVSDGATQQVVLEKIDRIADSIEAAPKTLAWKMRAKFGEKRSWYDSPDVH